MAFTSKLGTVDSQLGNIELASIGVGSLIQSIGSTLNFSQLVRGFNGNKVLNQSISFLDIVDIIKTYERSTSDSLIFVQAADVQQIRTASNTIVFSDLADVQSYKGANDTIVFTQTLISQYNPHSEYLQQSFVISQSVSAGSQYNRSLSQTITISGLSTVIRARFFNVNNTLSLHDNLTLVKINTIVQPLTLSQTLVQHRIINRSLTNTLTLNHALNRQVVYNFHVSNQLVFLNTHKKNSGTGTDLDLPNLIVTKPQQLVIFQVPGQAVTFKPPLFGDTEAGKGKLIQQRTITGNQFTYVRRSFSRKLVYKFDISITKAEEFRVFILNYLSTPMLMTNWKGEQWYGHVVNNPFDFAYKNRSTPGEDVEIEVQFDGVQVH